MLSPEGSVSPLYGENERRTLREMAWASIQHGLLAEVALRPDAGEFGEALQKQRACFVTLREKSSGDLRGCVGGLEARLPLVSAVAQSAFNAAFRDPRFPALAERELQDVELHLSVLSPLEHVRVSSERELCDRLRPGIDGLVLTEGTRSATFLPDVWQSLREPEPFVRELKKKAGMALDYWSPSMQVQRYTSESF